MNIERYLLKFINFFNLKQRDIYRLDKKLYLTRYYIFRKPVKWMPSLYIHCFHSSDDDYELHNHGWSRSISFILSGSYREERLIKDKKIKIRTLKFGSFNYIKANDFHRVDLLTPKVWTIFLSGAKIQDWGFLDRETLEYTPWKEHVTKKFAEDK
jgi:hypothetical protein